MRAPQEQNNLNAIRLLAAVAVLISHSFPLAYGSDVFEPVHRLSKGQTTIGHLGVLIFFAISGYLITQSFVRSSSRMRFVAARALRLLPALAVVLVVVTYAIGPFVTALPLSEYFTSLVPYRYAFGNLVLVLQFRDHLPGVFLQNPLPQTVNGSLWTLQYEALCYAAVFVLGIARLARWPSVLVILVLAIVAEHARRLGVIPELAIPFATGALVSLVPIGRHWLPATACAFIALLSLRFGGFSVVGGVFGSYAVLTFGLTKSRWLPDPMPIVGDLSYGVYVWAFPIQQIIAGWGGDKATWWSLAACSLPPTLAAAWVSWHLIERPALSLKPDRSKKVSALVQ